MILCVMLPDGAPSEDVLMEAFLAAVPRVALEPPWAWLDARGAAVGTVHGLVRRRLRRLGVRARYGAAVRPAAARVAARTAPDEAVVVVEAGAERAFLEPHGLADLGVEDPLLGWLADVGIGTCGELAAVAREAVEVRFGADAVTWWRLARGTAERRLFLPVPPEQPNASVDFIDYVVTDPERLIFTANALLAGLCERMREHGTHVRRLRLRLPLANGSAWERTLKTARPTADRAAWLRLARALLERLTVPDAVAGMSIEVEATETAAAVQGDLFDTGFATASAVETAVARLMEDQGDVVLEPAAGSHPLVEQRTAYRPLTMREVLRPARQHVRAEDSNHLRAPAGARAAASPDGSTMSALDAAEPVGLTLQLLPEPRAILVESADRRDHATPVRYRDGRWHSIVHAAGPDRVSGGQWDATYAREYFRAVTAEGALVWLFRDAGRDRWYLHGWWD